MRKRFEAGFKAKVVLEAFRGEKTLSQLGGEYGVHPNQIGQGKKELLEGVAEVFGTPKTKKRKESSQQEMLDKLYRNIGELKVEND